MDNAVRLFNALAQFGAPLDHDGITADTFSKSGLVYQIGVDPVRIDILTGVSGVGFAEAWQNRVESAMYGEPVYFISLNDLIKNKKAAGRPSDLADLKDIRS